MKVLLAEDNVDHRHLLELILRSGEEEYDVTSVDTGAAFLERLHSGSYDIALIDYHLPDCDANEILARADEAPETPPIIVLSSDSDSETIIAALRSGGRDFLPKAEAFDAVRLMERIREALRRRRCEERLIERQKDECLSVLAGGIAHDFNNMLVGILGKAALLGRMVPAGSKEADYCIGIQRTAQRLADLAKQLLAYARGGKYQPRVIDLNESVADTLAMLQGSFVESNVQVKTFLGPAVWRVRADHSQMVQTLLNLCINSVEAMTGGGTLSIFSENVRKTDAWACRLAEHHTPGDYVHVVVADTGDGVSPAVINRVFDPYFSTKGTNRGLGLAAVKGIIRNHGGGIAVRSKEGHGTAFHLYLPRWVEPAEPSDDDANAREHTGLDILIAEDDGEVCEVAADILRAAGHRVMLANTGRDAIEQMRASGGRIDVLILDMRLPDCNGSEVYHACRASREDTRVVICSGYDRSAVVQDVLANDALVRFLPKPFTPEALLAAILEPTPTL